MTLVLDSPVASAREEYIASVRQKLDPRLLERAQWVCWRRHMRKGKLTKVLFDARSHQLGDSTDPTTWCSFEEACEACSSNRHYEGVGFVFSRDDPFCGIDLDNCVELATDELKPWGRQLVERLDSYTETSPSGCGVKIIVEATKPSTRCSKGYEDGKVEIYDRSRFFTITGRHLPGTPALIQPRQEQLEAVYRDVFENQTHPTAHLNGHPVRPITRPPPPSPEQGLSDEKILRKAGRSRSGAKFKALLAGNWQGAFVSQSEADSSLVFMLAFYTKDPAQIDRLFRQSGLVRPKWDEKHGARTYGQMTIDNALQKVTERYVPSARGAGPIAGAAGQTPADEVGLISLGNRDPASGRLVLSPKKTLPTARAFLEDHYSHPEGRTLHSYAGSLLVWRLNRFVEIEEGSLEQTLQQWLHKALRYRFDRSTRQLELARFESNPATVRAALASIRAEAHLPATLTPAAWLKEGDSRPDPRNLLPFPSGTLDLETCQVLKPTPALFNINAIDFDYDPSPEPPELWISFLEQLWGEDLESVHLLQEWMGYCLVADTSQQKMLLMVGPKRSGKGTIGRILTRLVGAGNVIGPTTSSLAGNFGLQPLIGKSLAIVSDARFSGENIAVVVERLLCISGEDTLTVDRKHQGSVTMKLPTRFMLLANELPRMNDASGALAGRFVILRLTRSFYGQEDTELTQKLTQELPGILLWAIEGLGRLRARGRFVQPRAVTDAVRDLEDLASPVLAFVRDCCTIGPGQRAWVDDMYRAWKAWCESDGRNTITSKQVFGRDLAAAVPGVICRRHSVQGRFYDGITLRGQEVAP